MGTSTTSSQGRLLVCATPIGNASDITQRVVEALDSASAIYAEDTRVTCKLLQMLGIDATVIRCDENVTERVIPQIVSRVEDGQTVAFVSDAGMPCISDPGQRVVAALRERGLAVEVLPGASAVTTAVAGSGFVGSSFYFGGFFPRKAGERRRLLESLAPLDAMLVFYESNHRTVSALRAIDEVLPNRRVCMARELTKVHEEYAVDLPGTLADSIEARGGELRGEIVLVIEPPSKGGGSVPAADAAAVSTDAPFEETLAKAAEELSVQEGMGSSKIAKELQRRFGIPREQAYEVARSCKKKA